MYVDRPDSLGKRLRKLRQDSGVKSPAELVRRLGRKYSVSGVLKRERGEIKIDSEYVEDLSRALGLQRAIRERYLALAEVYAYQFNPWHLHQRGVSALQFEYWKRVRSSRSYSQYEPLCICALLQTEDYAYEALRSFGLDHATSLESARSRFHMCSTFLDEYKNTKLTKPSGSSLPMLTLIQDEEALFRIPGSRRVILDQLAYLKKLLTTSSVNIRILPRATFKQLPQFYNFNLFDDYLAGLETPCGHVYVTDIDTISMLERWFKDLEEQSVGRKAAAGIVEKVLLTLEGLGSRKINHV